MRGPAITVQCECGAAQHVPYGERWTCERCGRSWNTAQVPADEYRAIIRDMRNLRLSVIGVALVLTVLFGLLALLVSESLFLLLPVVLAAWFILYMPHWRRRVRRRARSVPSWDLHPE
jgi:hypothetical protein